MKHLVHDLLSFEKRDLFHNVACYCTLEGAVVTWMFYSIVDLVV